MYDFCEAQACFYGDVHFFSEVNPLSETPRGRQMLLGKLPPLTSLSMDASWGGEERGQANSNVLALM